MELKIVPDTEFEKIFSNIVQIRLFSDALLKELEERIKAWDVQTSKIADILVRVGPFIKIFYDYTEKYNENSKLFLKLQEKYPKFKKAVDEFDMRPNSKNKLTFCFMDPFQRLPR